MPCRKPSLLKCARFYPQQSNLSCRQVLSCLLVKSCQFYTCQFYTCLFYTQPPFISCSSLLAVLIYFIPQRSAIKRWSEAHSSNCDKIAGTSPSIVACVAQSSSRSSVRLWLICFLKLRHTAALQVGCMLLPPLQNCTAVL
jgi:hypothetical protein